MKGQGRPQDRSVLGPRGDDCGGEAGACMTQSNRFPVATAPYKERRGAVRATPPLITPQDRFHGQGTPSWAQLMV